MKIISKYKDYYDYLVGIYGEDPKLVLDRREGTSIIPSEVFALCIGNKMIQGIYKNNTYYYGDQLDQLDRAPTVGQSYLTYLSRHRYDKTKNILYYFDADTKYRNNIIVNKLITDTNLNSKEGCPILLYRIKPTGDLTDEPYKFPKLEHFNLASFLPPKEIWIILSAFLASMVIEPTVPIGGDDIRIQSHGFDLKTSFRPKIKV